MYRKTVVFGIALFWLFPILILLLSLISNSEPSYWMHTSMFPRYISNTVTLMLGVAFLTLLFGVSSAFFVTFFDFPGKKMVQIALFLPLAIPAYITAFTFGYIFEFAGPVQTFLRSAFDCHFFPNIRSIGGAIFVMSISFYPYIYMLARTSFSSLGSMVNVSKTFGKKPLNILFNLIIPISRPAIVSGLTFVLMEVIADFGTAQLLAIDTFSTGIYRTWFLLHDYNAASRLTCIILLFVAVLFTVEYKFRKKKNYYDVLGGTNRISTWIVTRKIRWLMLGFCIFLPLVGFVLPLIPLIFWAFENVQQFDYRLFGFVNNTIFVSCIASAIAVFISFVLAYMIRKNFPLPSLVRLSTIGYAIPNSVIAVGILILLGAFSKLINYICVTFFGLETNVMLIGTISALLYAYVFRFLAVSMGVIESGFNKIPREIDWVSCVLGSGSCSTCLKVYCPMIMKSFITAFVLVFIDISKELAATLIIRPFNFETIATRTYELVADEQYRQAAVPALLIMFVGVGSVFLLSKLLYSENLYCYNRDPVSCD